MPIGVPGATAQLLELPPLVAIGGRVWSSCHIEWTFHALDILTMC